MIACLTGAPVDVDLGVEPMLDHIRREIRRGQERIAKILLLAFALRFRYTLPGLDNVGFRYGSHGAFLPPWAARAVAYTSSFRGSSELASTPRTSAMS
jgi:hypothetical protein